MGLEATFPREPSRFSKKKFLTRVWTMPEREPLPLSFHSQSPEEKRRIMVNRLSEIVRLKEGWFDEAAYTNKRTAIGFRCAKGHTWSVQPQTVLHGSWCRTCWNEDHAGKYLKIDGLAIAREIAVGRGGECLSENYTNNKSRLLWKCSNNHEWEAALNDVRKGSWCPICGAGVRERLCKHYLERFTGKPFIKSRPPWLVNSRGNLMELDGYNAELALAFEHQGKQHYEPVAHFNRRSETLQLRKQDDQAKRDACLHHNVTLLEVPYSVDSDKLPEWMLSELLRLRPEIVVSRDSTLIGYLASSELSDLKAFVQGRGGDCLSEVYMGVDKHHRFSCQFGHEWTAKPSNIKSGSWCPVCKPDVLSEKRRLYSVSSMQDLASERGGTFISTSFKSVNERYEWRCMNGHQWSAAPTDVMKGTWCRKCSFNSKKAKISEAMDIATQRGGRCLSADMYDSYSKLLWECAEGHQWEARFNNVKNSKSWCPECARRKIKKQ